MTSSQLLFDNLATAMPEQAGQDRLTHDTQRLEDACGSPAAASRSVSRQFYSPAYGWQVTRSVVRTGDGL